MRVQSRKEPILLGGKVGRTPESLQKFMLVLQNNQTDYISQLGLPLKKKKKNTLDWVIKRTVIYFLTVSEPGKSKIMVLAGKVSF